MTGESLENSEFYTAEASSYDVDRWMSSGGSATKALQEALFREMTRHWRDNLTLEVGPGTGRFSAILSERQSTLVLTDVAAGMIPVATKASKQFGATAAPVLGSVLHLPFATGSFAHVVCLNVLNHVGSLEESLASLARVLSPGGELLFNYANRRSVYWPAAVYITRRGRAIGKDVSSRWDRRGDVLDAVSSAGLEVLDERGHVHAPRSIDRLIGGRTLQIANRIVGHCWMRKAGSFVYLRCQRREGSA